ncbi:hypothetical protein ACH47B_31310 [Rhodococcus sp. NPDC019627]|uniref:hypothetical protein n=1 Tax=unclassified Rhodococcus (in: high G+C Gram-positive bacteria) TaxID=192944 RepID=UPI0033D265D9
MSVRPIIDAGPALNFLAINKERLLIKTVGPISTPETVAEEVFRKSRSDSRFGAVEKVWAKIPPKFLQILSDDITPALNAAVIRISELPMAERKTKAKDLGEVMVVAHAVVAAETGHDVTVIIDDQAGARVATAEKQRLDRLREAGKPVGSIALVNTVTILQRAAGGEYLPDKGAMRAVYTRLRGCDDGLQPIERTPLLSAAMWR